MNFSAQLLSFHELFTKLRRTLAHTLHYLHTLKNIRAFCTQFHHTGLSKDEIKSSPFIEQLIRKGYEVIYFTDVLDEYVMQVSACMGLYAPVDLKGYV